MAIHQPQSLTTGAVSQGQSASTADRRRWWILALVGLAQSMLIIDVTVVNVALPSIGSDLGLDRAGLTWVVTAYTLFFGSLLLLGGRLADAFGRRRMFLTGLGVFTGASLLSGLAPDGTMLVGSRAAQGIGAAILAPAALSLITTTFEGPERARALGVWAALGGAGAAFGVVLGGLLAGGPGWQWIFFVNVPVGVAVAAGVMRLVSAGGPDGERRFDLPGGVIATAAVGLLLLGLIGAGDAGWASVQTVAAIGSGVVAVVVFVAVEARSRQPLVRLELLRTSRVGGPLTIMLAAAGLLAGGFFLNSLYLQRVVGQAALETGLTFIPVALALVVGAQAGAHVIGRVGARKVAAAGLLSAAIGLAYLARMPAEANVMVDVLPGFVLAAAGLGPTFMAATTAAFGRSDRRDAGMTSGLVNTAHELGFAVGVAGLSTIAGASLAGAGNLVGGFQIAFLAAAVAAIVAAGLALALLPAEKLTPPPGFAH